jgi:SAM-dependent methyltransferase
MADRDDTPATDAIAKAVATRYGALATSAGSLSCGGALDVAAPRPGELVVDLGCGRGGDLVRAAALVGPDGVVIGIDASEAMLAAARSRVHGLPNVRLVRSDLAAVAVPAESADIVVSNCAINHAPNKRAAFLEVHRLLRPGGRFAVSDVVAERELPPEVRNDPAAWAACYGGAIPEPLYLEAIAAAGLEDVIVVRRTAPYERGGVRVFSITVQGRRR